MTSCLLPGQSRRGHGKAARGLLVSARDRDLSSGLPLSRLRMSDEPWPQTDGAVELAHARCLTRPVLPRRKMLIGFHTPRLVLASVEVELPRMDRTLPTARITVVDFCQTTATFRFLLLAGLAFPLDRQARFDRGSRSQKVQALVRACSVDVSPSA